MKKIYFEIAGFTFKIVLKNYSEGTETQSFFSKIITNYLNGFIKRSYENKTVEYTVEIENKSEFEMIFNQKLKKNYLLLFENISPRIVRTYYYISYQQLQIVLRNFCQILLSKHDGFIIHGSATLIDNKAHIFLGKSGAGKSTTMKILSKDFLPLADDILIVKKEGSKYLCYQTPFIEKNVITTKGHKGIEIAALYFVKKSKSFQIKRIANKETVMTLLIPQLFTNQHDKSVQIKYLLSFIKSFENFNYLYWNLANPNNLIKLFK